MSPKCSIVVCLLFCSSLGARAMDWSEHCVKIDDCSKCIKEKGCSWCAEPTKLGHLCQPTAKIPENYCNKDIDWVDHTKGQCPTQHTIVKPPSESAKIVTYSTLLHDKVTDYTHTKELLVTHVPYYPLDKKARRVLHEYALYVTHKKDAVDIIPHAYDCDGYELYGDPDTLASLKAGKGLTTKCVASGTSMVKVYMHIFRGQNIAVLDISTKECAGREDSFGRNPTHPLSLISLNLLLSGQTYYEKFGFRDTQTQAKDREVKDRKASTLRVCKSPPLPIKELCDENSKATIQEVVRVLSEHTVFLPTLALDKQNTRNWLDPVAVDCCEALNNVLSEHPGSGGYGEYTNK